MSKKYAKKIVLASMAAVPLVLSAAVIDSSSSETTVGTPGLRVGDPNCNEVKGGATVTVGGAWSGMPGPGATSATGQAVPNMMNNNQSISAAGGTVGQGIASGGGSGMWTGGSGSSPWGGMPGTGGGMTGQVQASETGTATMSTSGGGSGDFSMKMSGQGMGNPNMGMGGPGVGIGGPGMGMGSPGMGYGPIGRGNTSGEKTIQDQSSEKPDSSDTVSGMGGPGMGMGGPGMGMGGPGMGMGGPGMGTGAPGMGMGGPGMGMGGPGMGMGGPGMGMGGPGMGYGPLGGGNASGGKTGQDQSSERTDTSNAMPGVGSGPRMEVPGMGMGGPGMSYGPWSPPGMVPPGSIENRLEKIEQRLDNLIQHLQQNVPQKQ
ncbi:exported hypothetical protein [Gammaproteobacteria bacterium]